MRKNKLLYPSHYERINLSKYDPKFNVVGNFRLIFTAEFVHQYMRNLAFIAAAHSKVKNKDCRLFYAQFKGYLYETEEIYEKTVKMANYHNFECML